MKGCKIITSQQRQRINDKNRSAFLDKVVINNSSLERGGTLATQQSFIRQKDGTQADPSLSFLHGVSKEIENLMTPQRLKDLGQQTQSSLEQ